MKVGTDAMILGAFATVSSNDKLLDIGAGTGVISLMLSQKADEVDAHAVELDAEAIKDLEFNFQHSPFNSHYHIYHENFLTWKTDEKFDVIITNPPFYKNSFSINEVDNRSKARNESHLPFDTLIEKSNQLLTDNGVFWIIIPSSEKLFIEKLASKVGLFVAKEIDIFGKPEEPIRTIFCFVKTPAKSQQFIAFTIRDSNGFYTNEYIELTKEFHAKEVVK